jgi:hypothetical protein
MIPEDERRKYALRQYESLRAECEGARGAQHTILQWNQAVSGTLFAAALVAGASQSERFVVAARFIFGLVVPAVLLGGALAWAGEMIRMERTGIYLRSLERAVWGNESGDALKDTSFFIWENFLWFPPERFSNAGYRKQNVGYVGVAVFYTIMFLGSLIAFWILSPLWLSVVLTVVLVLLGCAVMILPALQIFSLGGAALRLSNEELNEWFENLPQEKSTPQSALHQFVERFFVGSRKSMRKVLRRKN